MATNSNSTNNQEKAVHQVERVNLYDFGYEKSGNVKGDPEIYQSYLNRIVNGDLVEENYKGLSEDEKKDKREKIKELEKALHEIETNNSKVESEIQVKEKKIDEFRQEVLKIREVQNNDHEKIKKEAFSTLKFSLNLFILIMLSVYLFFFYVSAAYKALYVDFEKVADNIAQGIGTGSIMPGPYELSEAIRYNYLLFLVPFVFYAFGWAFHILLELKQKVKYVFLGLLIAVTFTVDFLIAMIIHNNTEMAKELMGLSTKHWSSSSTFYIILFLGFLVYIIWSILLDSLLREWDKRKITANIKKIIKHLQNDIKILQKRLRPVQHILDQIAAYREDVNTVMYGNLKKYIEQFSSGWIAYLSPNNMKAVKERCLGIKKDFEEKHGVKPGVVKVIARRG
jgi:DNA-binding FrmR family transcriptional regulator